MRVKALACRSIKSTSIPRSLQARGGAKLEPSQSRPDPTWNPEMPMNEAKTKAQARVQIP